MRQTRAQASCNSKLKRYISVLYNKYENPKQAIAVSYSMTKRKFPNCNRYLQRNRPVRRQQQRARRPRVMARQRRRQQPQRQPLRRSQRIRNRRRR